MLALAEGRPVGVDIERLHVARTAERMAARWFPPEEARFVAEPAEPAERAARFTVLWCRREACVKAYGGARAVLRRAGGRSVTVAGGRPGRARRRARAALRRSRAGAVPGCHRHPRRVADACQLSCMESELTMSPVRRPLVWTSWRGNPRRPTPNSPCCPPRRCRSG
ncbi:4'-phosphopantetheinyl transferase family protein [Kitasatospora brasiliensis]|uniref:4'-phosphopantetheinyl transferase family protein n=1 Tax=Kitasatospora brasiliensis TaxID=3058040 RepID=UPI003D786D72